MHHLGLLHLLLLSLLLLLLWWLRVSVVWVMWMVLVQLAAEQGTRPAGEPVASGTVVTPVTRVTEQLCAMGTET